MDINIDISTINKYFYQNKEKEHTPIKSSYRTKIVNYSQFSVNEATVCHKISKIPYYSNYFAILNDYESLNISQLNDNIIENIFENNGIIIEKLDNLKDKRFFLFKYSDKNSIDFIDFLYNSTCIKKLIFNTINAFQHLLQGLYLLNENNICFFDISPKNIIFLENYREKPVLSNFTFSLQINRLDFIYFSKILEKIDNLTYQPLEVHILFYFVKHNMETISYSFIEEFCENYIENMNILNIFSENYRKSYKAKCIETMRKYVNLHKIEIIRDILERNNKWDVYGISMIFLQIFASINRVFSLKDTFISKITLELSSNLHPDSHKRMSLEDTLDIFNTLLHEQHDWLFINNLDNSKLEQLLDEFSK